jgi:UDP-glucose 4-epimerase
MDTTVLITGANGFVGKNLVAALAEDPDISVVATDLHHALIPLDGVTLPQVDYVPGDLCSRTTISFLEDNYRFTTIIHLAAVIAQSDSRDANMTLMSSNTGSTQRLLELASAHGARMMLSSTALIYGDAAAPFTEDMPPMPGSFYALSKVLCEETVRFYHRKFALPYLIFRIGVFYGLGQSPSGGMFIPSVIDHLLDGKEFAMTAGEQLRDFVYIGDFVDLVRAAIKTPAVSGVFNVGSGDKKTMREVAALVEWLTNTKGLLRTGALPYRTDEVWNYSLDISRTQRAFGWEPATTLENGLLQTIEYQKRVKAKLCC